MKRKKIWHDIVLKNTDKARKCFISSLRLPFTGNWLKHHKLNDYDLEGTTIHALLYLTDQNTSRL